MWRTWVHRRATVAASVMLTLTIAVTGTIYAVSTHQSTPKPMVVMSGYNYQPNDLSVIANQSDFVIEGIVSAVGPAHWTTADGKAPANMQNVLNGQTQLRTPVTLQLRAVYKGKLGLQSYLATGSSLIFSIPGGDDGSIQIRAEDNTTLTPGAAVVAFLSKAPANAESWTTISPLYPQMLFVVDGAQLRGPQKTIQRSTFTQHRGVAE